MFSEPCSGDHRDTITGLSMADPADVARADQAPPVGDLVNLGDAEVLDNVTPILGRLRLAEPRQHVAELAENVIPLFSPSRLEASRMQTFVRSLSEGGSSSDPFDDGDEESFEEHMRRLTTYLREHPEPQTPLQHTTPGLSEWLGVDRDAGPQAA